MMRVLHIIGTLNPESGGPASTVAALMDFSRPECENEVVSLDDPNAAYLRDLDFAVNALGPTSVKYGYTPKLLPWLEQNGERFDGVVVHGLWQYCGYAARKAFEGRRPYLVFAHGMLDPYFKRAFPFKHFKKWVYWLLVEHWVLRGAYRVLFTNIEEEKLARQSFSLNQWSDHVVPIGATFPPGDDGDRKQTFLSLFPQLRGRRYLLFLGRIDRKKGCDLLIDAFVQVASTDPDLHLVMAGPDEQQWRTELERAAFKADLASRVHWTGMLTGAEKWGAFLAAEAFVLPSHQENFGVAVAEAMACGKAALLSDKVNIASEIAEADAGLVEEDTLAGTRRLLTNWIAMLPEERQSMGDCARRLFEQRYDMRINAGEVTRLFWQAMRPSASIVTSPDPVLK